MSENKNYYQILGIDKKATPEEIKKTYRKLSLKYHPDRNRGNEEGAKTKFQEIGEAYSVLSDSNKRSQYDRYGSVSETDYEDMFERASNGLVGERVACMRSGFALHGVTAEDLDPSLGNPYHDGEDKVWALKDKYGEYKVFLDSLGKAVEKASERKKEEQQREGKKNSDLRHDVFNSIQEEFNKKESVGGLIIYAYDWDLNPSLGFPHDHGVGKLGEIELSELDSFKAEMIEAIKETRNKKVAEEKSKQQNETDQKEKSEKERKLRQDISKEILDRFFHDPYTYYGDLDSSLGSPYKSGQDKFWDIEFSQVEDFKKQMFDAIDKDKKKFQKERINRIYEEAKTKGGSDLEEAINNVEKERGSEAYENDKEKIKNLKRKAATENVESYRQKFIKRLKEDMKREGISVHDLEDENALERCNNIGNPSELVEAEMIVVSQVEKVKADKGLDKIINQIKQVLNSVASQEKVEEVKNKILEFISSPNIYCQSAYSKQRPEVQSLLSRLNNYSAPETIDPNNGGLSLKVVLPIAAVLLLVMLLGVSFVRQKSKNRY